MSNLEILVILIKLINPTTDKTKRIFAIFEPTMFPTDKSGELLNTASIETNNSDIDVPKPTITSPIKNSEIFNFLPIAVELLIKKSAPLIAR